MALENVIDEIISHAEKQKQEIINQAEDEAEKLLAQARNKTEEQAKLFAEETKKLIDENERMEISALNIHLHKMMLETKKEILDGIYQRLVEKLNKLDSHKRKGIIEKLVEKAKKELPEAVFFYSNEKDKEFVSNMKGIHFKDVIDCSGGIIAENADGTIRVNYTFEELLENVKDGHLNETAKRIF